MDGLSIHPFKDHCTGLHWRLAMELELRVSANTDSTGSGKVLLRLHGRRWWHYKRREVETTVARREAGAWNRRSHTAVPAERQHTPAMPPPRQECSQAARCASGHTNTSHSAVSLQVLFTTNESTRSRDSDYLKKTLGGKDFYQLLKPGKNPQQHYQN